MHGSLLLQASRHLLASYFVGVPFIAFIPSVASGDAVTLAVDAAYVTAIAFVIAVPCNPDVADLPAIGGVPGVV